MKTFQLMSVCSLVIASAIARPAAAERVLTLKDAFERARKENRDLRAARSRIDQSEAQWSSALAALLPKVGAQFRYTHNYKEAKLDTKSFASGVLGLAGLLQQTTDSPAQAAALGQYIDAVNAQNLSSIIIQKGEQIDFGLSATVPLIVPQAYPQLSGAKHGVEASKATYAATEQGMLWAVAQAFYAAAGVDELAQARQNAVKVAQQTLQNAKARFEAGTVNRVEVTRAELAVVRAEQALAETQDIRKNAYQGLSTLLLLDEPFRVDTSDVGTVERPVDQMAAAAVAQRYELTALQKSRLAANDAALAGILWWVPQVSAFGNVRAFNYKGFTGDNYSWAVGLQLDWTLFDGGYALAQRKAAKAQAQEAELRREQLERSVKDEVATAARAIPIKRRAVEAAKRGVELSQETLNLVRVQHEAGTATQLDLLQAQDALVTAEVLMAQARFDLQSAQVQLQKATGELGSR